MRASSRRRGRQRAPAPGWCSGARGLPETPQRGIAPRAHRPCPTPSPVGLDATFNQLPGCEIFPVLPRGRTIPRMRNLIAIAMVVMMSLAHASRAATLEEILAKNLAARGGEARLREVKTLRLTGRVMFGGRGRTIEAPWGQVQKRPGMMRSETTLQGLTQVSAYDGHDGWAITPFQGRLDPEKASQDEAHALAQLAEIDGPLVGWRDKGHRVEYLGSEDVDGTPAIKLRVTRKDGDLQYVYLDPDSYLEIRITTVHKARGAEQISETDLGGYQQVNGVWFPFAQESGGKGAPRNVHVTIERGEANVAADDAWFKLPAPKTPVVAVISAAPGEAAALAPAVAPPPPTEKAVLDGGVISGLG